MKQLAVASKRQIADVVVKNGKIINVFTHDIIEGDIAIADGKIVGIGEYDGQTIIDAKGKYVCPGSLTATFISNRRWSLQASLLASSFHTASQPPLLIRTKLRMSLEQKALNLC